MEALDGHVSQNLDIAKPAKCGAPPGVHPDPGLIILGVVNWLTLIALLV
jgi:hypothetical protein